MKCPRIGRERAGLVAALGLLASLHPEGRARAATTQSFTSGGTPFELGTCSGALPPAIVPAAGGERPFLRLLGVTDRFGFNGVGFERSDPGAFSRIVIDLDFRITPGQGRADGMAIVLANTALHGRAGGLPCLTREEPNVPGALGIGLDIYDNGVAEGDGDANHVSLHYDGKLIAKVKPVLDLASGGWIHAQIEVWFGGPNRDVSVTLTPEGGAAETVMAGQQVAGLVPYESRLHVAGRTGGETSSQDIAGVRVDYQSDPVVQGRWSAPQPMPVVAIHSVLLPSGKVLYFDRAAAGTDTTPRLWDPLINSVVEVPHPGKELFCSGHNFDAQGRLIITGGHDHHDGFGLDTTFAYDFMTNTFSELPKMAGGRWYPTNTLAGNGDILVIAGTVTDVLSNLLPQVFEARTGRYRDLTTATREMPYYPFMFLAPDGRMFNAGPNKDAAFLDVTGTGAWSAPIPSHYGERNYGTAVLYDEGKVALIGGAFVTNSVEAIDLAAHSPHWEPKAPMAFARRQHNALILPDGKVLVTGGSATPEFNNSRDAVFASETWDPAADTWTMGNAMKVPRIYHAETLLLPDGRVVSMGGGHPASVGGENNFNLEIFSPPYLFQGDRPKVVSAPGSVAHGQTVDVQIDWAGALAQVNLLRISSATHSLNMDQRIVRLPFQREGLSSVKITIPGNPNLAPPGPYMLFLVTAAGVPSGAHMVNLGTPGTQEQELFGLTTVELEHHHDRRAGATESWTAVVAGGTRGITTVSGAFPEPPGMRARVDYWVEFARAGLHHVWVRGQHSDPGAVGCKVGIDGGQATAIAGFGSTLGWARSAGNGAPATLLIPTAGLHRVSLWAEGGGFMADKLVLASRAHFVPYGEGPVSR